MGISSMMEVHVDEAMIRKVLKKNDIERTTKNINKAKRNFNDFLEHYIGEKGEEMLSDIIVDLEF
jgi:hypothetical protein